MGVAETLDLLQEARLRAGIAKLAAPLDFAFVLVVELADQAAWCTSETLRADALGSSA